MKTLVVIPALCFGLGGFCLGGFGCGGGSGAATDSGKVAKSPPVTTEAASQDPEESPTAVQVAPSRPLTADEAKAQAEKLWSAAEKKQQDPDAWNQAASALAAAARSVPDDADKQKEFLRGALGAWERAESAMLATPVTPGQPDATRTRPLSSRELERLAVLKQLATLLDPSDAEVGRIEYRRGRVYWNHGHHKEAIPSFVIVVERFPASQEAAFASQLLLDSLALRKDFEGMKKQVKKMLGNTALLKDRPDLSETLYKLRHQAGRKEADQLVQDKNYPGCAKAFLKLYKRDAKLPGCQGDHLLYNASVCQERAGQIPQAIKTLRKLAKQFPQSGMAAKATERADALKAQR